MKGDWRKITESLMRSFPIVKIFPLGKRLPLLFKGFLKTSSPVKLNLISQVRSFDSRIVGWGAGIGVEMENIIFLQCFPKFFFILAPVIGVLAGDDKLKFFLRFLMSQSGT